MLRCPQCQRRCHETDLLCERDGSLLRSEVVLKGRYYLQERIGAGGMGFVYRARDANVNVVRAVKVLKPQLLEDDPAAFARFKREAELTAQLQQENAIRVTDFDKEEDYFFLVMDYLTGRTLQERLAIAGKPTLPDCAELLSQISKALDAAHNLGILHRDLKPSNIFLVPTTDGQEKVVVLDFGLAKLVTAADAAEDATVTRDRIPLGTPQYMSPEQCSGQASLDQRTDVYSLGIIAYQLVTGQVPFVGGPNEIYVSHISKNPEPLRKVRTDIAAELETVVLRALAKNPAERQQTVRQLAQEFKQALQIYDDPTQRTLKLETPEPLPVIQKREAVGPHTKPLAGVINQLTIHQESGGTKYLGNITVGGDFVAGDKIGKS